MEPIKEILNYMISSPYIVNGMKGEVERHNHCQPKKLLEAVSITKRCPTYNFAQRQN